MKRIYFLLTSGFLLVAAFGLSLQSAPQILLDETFTEGQRLTQRPPETSAWLVPDASAILDENGRLSLSLSESRMTLTFFTQRRDVFQLEVGQKLELHFGLSLDRPGSPTGAFRFALTNLPLRPSDGFFGNSHGSFVGTEGYAVFVTPSGNNQNENIRIRKRSNPRSNNLLSAAAHWEVLEGGVREGPTVFSSGVENFGKLTLERLDNETLAIEVELSGPDFPEVARARAVDASSPFTRFNSIAFFGLNSAGESFTLHRVRLVLNP